MLDIISVIMKVHGFGMNVFQKIYWVIYIYRKRDKYCFKTRAFELYFLHIVAMKCEALFPRF